MAVLAGYEHLRAAAERLQWDADAIDLTVDRARWPRVDGETRSVLASLLAGFWIAEHRVAAHLEPFVAAAATGLERELLERQAADERRHARFFDRVLGEVLLLDAVDDSPALAAAPIAALFERELPAMASALARGAVGLDRAVGLYHLILEAILLATGQDALIEQATMLPGVSAGVARVQADERWHVGLGVQLLTTSGLAWSPELDELATAAASAWGPAIATPERVRHAIATHRRRLKLLSCDGSD